MYGEAERSWRVGNHNWNILLENIFHKNYFKREVGGSMCVHQEGHENKVKLMSWEEEA